jgi:hypothetical protein
LCAIGTISARVSVDHRPVGRVQRGVQRQRRAGLALGQREGVDDGVRQHGDLIARHVDGGHAAARQLVDRVVRLDAQARRGDVDADLDVAVGQMGDREGVVDFGGGDVVDGERFDVGQRQADGAAGTGTSGKPAPFGKFSNRNLAMCSAFGDFTPPTASIRRCGWCAARRRRVQRLVFDAVLVRLEQQLHDDVLHRFRQLVGLQLFDVGGLHQRLLFLFSMPASAARSDCSGAAL